MSAILNWVCRHFHGAPMQPVKGKYRCRKCLREHPVPWPERV